MSVAGRKQAVSGAKPAQQRSSPVTPGKLTFNPVHAAYGNAYANAVESGRPAQTPGAPAEHSASHKQGTSGVKVTHALNTPIKPGNLAFSSVHAAYGNGYANAMGASTTTQTAPAPAKFDPMHKAAADGISVAQEPNKPVKPGKLSFGPEQAAYGSDYAKDHPKASPDRTIAQPQAAKSTQDSAATVGPDGTIKFADDALSAKPPGQAPAVEDPLAKLVADVAGKKSPDEVQLADPDAQTRQAMTKPADAPDALAEEAKEDETKPATPADAEAPVSGEDGKPGPLAKPGDEPPPPAKSGDSGGGGKAELSTWKSRVSGAIAATPQPTLGDGATSSITVISATGSGAAAKYRGGGGGGPAKDVKKAVRPPPPTPKPLPEPPLTAVPAADEVVKLASNKQLPDQELPVLQQRPGDAVVKEPAPPVIDKALAADLETAFEAPPAPEAAAKGDGKKPLDAKALKKLKEAKAKEPEPKKTSAGEKLVLQDVAPKLSPRPERGTKGQSKETFQLVLGEMLRDPGPKGEALAIIKEARSEAYPNKSLNRAYPDMGNDWDDPIKAELEAQVKAIADIAGISQAELVQAKAAREAQLEAMKRGELASLGKAAEDSKKATKEGGEEASRDIWAARMAQDEDTLQKAIAANGEADPEVIELRRDMGVRDLTRRAARQDVNYEKAGERRLRALDASQARMRSAYSTAAKVDEKQISALNYKQLYDAQIAAKKEPKEAEAAAQASLEQLAKPMWNWVQLRTNELKTAFETLKTAATTTTKTFRDGIKTALKEAKSLFSDWAEERIAAQEGWWDGLMRQFRQWMKDAQSDSAAWEEARNEQLRDAVVGDLQLVADVEAAYRQKQDIQAFVQERGVDAAQLAVIQTFFKPVGPEGKLQFDSIGAVAAGMRFRVRAVRKPQMIDRFKGELPKRDESEWVQGSIVATDEKPPFNVAAINSKLFHAMHQWGTEEGDIYAALGGLTPLQAKIVRDHYHLTYSGRRGKRTLDQDLDYELGGAEKDRADALLSGNQALADAAELREAMKGGLTGAGTDEATIMRVLRNKTPEEQAAIKAEYARMYEGADLDADLKEELDDGWGTKHDFNRAKALQANDVRLADAIGLDAAMHGGITGAGTDEGEITQIYEQNRAEMEAEAAKHGWSTEQMNAKIKERNLQVEQKYEVRYGDPKNVDNPTALRAAFKDELSDSELDLGNALADADLTRIDSAKLGVEKESFWSTSDETVNKIFEAQGKRAHQDVSRDAELDLNRRADLAALQGKEWDWPAEREKTKAFIEHETQNRAELYMDRLEGTFDKKFGTGGMVLMIAFNMSGEDQDKAWDLRKQGGILKPEQEIFYACNGAGTDLDKLKDMLKDKSPAQVQAIREAWVKRYGGKPEDFDARIKEEVSGRDLKDMEWALEGAPQTREGKLKRAEERKNYEDSEYGWFSSDDQDAARVIIDREYKGLLAEKAEFDKLSGAKLANESDEDYAARQDRKTMYEERFDLRSGYFDIAVEDHRKAVDSFADTAAMVAGIVATVIVIAVVSFFTAGTGGAAIIAALASAKVAAAMAVAAAAATIATKYAIKGGAYSQNELAIDAVVGAVDAVVSAATAGLGGGLLRAARAGAPTSKLAAWAAKTRLASGLSKMAKSERMVGRVFAGAVSEGIEGLASALPSALAGNVIDERNWAKGDPFSNILQGTVMQAGMAVALSGGLGGLGGIGKHVPDAPKTGDILAKRGDPADRLKAWKAFQLENPGTPFKQFSEQFDAGILAKEAESTARHAAQRELRGELLSGIPPAQRKQFAGVPIEVVNDADFARFTKSASGQAVVIFKDGKPLVLLREGADIKSLREEGIHLLQSKDPKLRKQFKSLDENNLRRWDKMGLDEQLSLYKTKIDIELDAQTKLIKQLDDQLAALEDPAMRKALMAQRKAAGETFENLGRRLDELGDISPLERLKMTRGEVPKPQYLDQEPRLFAKTKGLKGDAQLMAAHASAKATRAGRDTIADLIDNAKTRAMFTALFDNLDGRTKSFFARAHRHMKASGESFRTFLKGRAKGGRYDTSIALKSFATAIKEVATDDPLKLRRALRAMQKFLGNVRVSIGHLEPFFAVSTKVKRPERLFALVEEMAELVSYRRKNLPLLADLMEGVAGKKPKLLDEFVETIENLSALAKQRDAFPKGGTAWTKAQNALVAAAESLQRKRKFAIDKEKLSKVLEEFTRTGQFNPELYAEFLTAKFPLKTHGFADMKQMVTRLQASAKHWSANNVGPILQWSSLIEKLPAKNRAIVLADVEAYLSKKLVRKITEHVNSGYRKIVRKAVIENIVAGKDAAARTRGIIALMDTLRQNEARPGVIGSYWAEFCNQVFRGGTHPIKGDLAGVTHVPMKSLSFGGTSKMVDGALDVRSSTKLPIGINLVDDKAGSSLDIAQAKRYDFHLRNGTLTTSDSGPTVGLIYRAESMKEALKKSRILDDLGLHPNMRVVVLDPASNSFRVIPRAKATPRVGKSKKVKK